MVSAFPFVAADAAGLVPDPAVELARRWKRCPLIPPRLPVLIRGCAGVPVMVSLSTTPRSSRALLRGLRSVKNAGEAQRNVLNSGLRPHHDGADRNVLRLQLRAEPDAGRSGGGRRYLYCLLTRRTTLTRRSSHG